MPGPITSYSTQSGPRWKFQIHVPEDLEQPELGDITGRRGIRRAADVTTRNKAKTTKTGSARVLDLDSDTFAVLKA